MIALNQPRNLVVGLAGTALITALAGCGVQQSQTPAAAPKAPTAYAMTVSESLPSSPEPIMVTWKGTIKRNATTFSHLTQQIGTTPPMTLAPAPKTPPISKSTLTPNASKGKSKASIKASSKSKTVSHSSTKATPVMPAPPPVMPVLASEMTLWNTAHPSWPLAPLPTVDATLEHPLVLKALTPNVSQTWHEPISLQGMTLAATETLTATVARPEGIFREAEWTLVITTQSTKITPKKGKPYLLPALTWTERGHVNPQS